MNFRTAYMNSSLITYSWKDCGGTVVATIIDDFAKRECIYKNYYCYFTMGKKTLLFSKNHPITFYKHIGKDYVAWCSAAMIDRELAIALKTLISGKESKDE